MIFFLVVALLALSYVLSWSTDVLVLGIKQISRGSKFEAFGLTTFLVALATSLPELFIGVTSAVEGKPVLPLGVAVGSNIANISLIIGGAALIAGAVKARDEFFRKDVLYAFLIGSLPLLLLLDSRLGRTDGLVLLVVYFIFVLITLSGKLGKVEEEAEDKFYVEKDWSHRILRVFGQKDLEQGLARLVVGSALLIVCSDLIVRLSVYIAGMLNIPTILVGLFMVSVGTSLPELTFEIKTIGKKEFSMAYGNVIGSTVANSGLILGVVALLSPIQVGRGMNAYFISVITFVLLFSLFWVFTWSKKSLDRWEGAVLVGAYFVFALVQMRFIQ